MLETGGRERGPVHHYQAFGQGTCNRYERASEESIRNSHCVGHDQLIHKGLSSFNGVDLVWSTVTRAFPDP